MPISLAETRRIAQLAHLRLEEPEAERLCGHLEHILAHVDELRRLDTTDVEPAVGMAGANEQASPRPRPDDVVPGLPREQALANAPDGAAGHFKVPRVIT